MDDVETALQVLSDCADEADRLMASDLFEQAGRGQEAAWLRESRLVLALCGGRLLWPRPGRGFDGHYLLELVAPDGDRVFIHPDSRHRATAAQNFHSRVAHMMTRLAWHSPGNDLRRQTARLQLAQPYRNNYWVVVAKKDEAKAVQKLFRRLEVSHAREAKRLQGS